jgi:subtilisin family serine protease
MKAAGLMDQKIENLLNISLEATPDELDKSSALSVGYDTDTNKWEVIVKNNRPIYFLEEMFPNTEVYELLGGYGIVRANKRQLEQIAELPEIDYMEMPKSFYYSLSYSKNVSCIYTGSGLDNLNGSGIIVAVIDSGIDILNPQFLNSDGTSRIISILNQQDNTEYDKAAIDEAVRLKRQVAQDFSGHGTNVAHIAAGKDGVAGSADIIAVKLASFEQKMAETSFVQTASIMRAFDFVVRKAQEFGKPAAINLSIGNNSGPHDGSSLLETYIDYISTVGRNVICVGSGNEAMRGIHASGVLKGEQILELAIGEYESSFAIQLWKNFSDMYMVQLITPSGRRIGPYFTSNQVNRYMDDNVEVLTFIGEPSPYSVRQEIYFEILPADTFIESGIWRIVLMPQKVVNGAYDIWLSSSAVINTNSGFLQNSPEMTITIPSTAKKVIAVGAYDQYAMSYAAFSGRGAANSNNVNYYNALNKPDILAPGVNVVLDSGKITERVVTGTSFAAPFVTGAAACLMQWGITNGNDQYMYGEKVKAYLLRGANQLFGFGTTPNNVTGWGALCLKASLTV